MSQLLILRTTAPEKTQINRGPWLDCILVCTTLVPAPSMSSLSVLATGTASPRLPGCSWRAAYFAGVLWQVVGSTRAFVVIPAGSP